MMVAKFSFREVAPCLFAIFVDVLGFGIMAPLLIALFTEGNLFALASPHLRYLALGVTLAINPLLMFLGTSFIGDLSDIIGRKKTLLLSMFAMAASYLLMSVGIWEKTLSLFLLGRASSGLASACQSVALATLSDISKKENKALHLSYVALVQCLGFVIGPLVGGVLYDEDLVSPFLWAALLACAAFFSIALFFKETLVKKSDRKIRILKVFVEAYRNRRIRKLSLIFFLMQIGVGLYFPIILILLSVRFGYSPLLLGLFNGYIGVGLALGLLYLLPQMLKRYKIEKIVCVALFITALVQYLTSIFYTPAMFWLLALPLAIAIEIAFAGMFTAFSNAADAKSQGWVMGISVSIMAIGWALAGLSTEWDPTFGNHILIFIGSLFLGASAFLMQKYCANTLVKND